MSFGIGNEAIKLMASTIGRAKCGYIRDVMLCGISRQSLTLPSTVHVYFCQDQMSIIDVAVNAQDKKKLLMRLLPSAIN